MSVTALLVPVDEAEAEALLRDDDAAWAALEPRTTRLRSRVARVDQVREELHRVLFPRWEGATPPSLVDRLRTFFRQRPPPTLDARGYDPFVHVFGRSLPANGRSPLAVAERLSALLGADDGAFEQALSTDFAGFDPAARAVWLASTPITIAPADRLRAARTRLVRHLANGETRLAWTELVRVFAWSRPLWRLDGEQLPDLLRTLGVGIEVQDARRVFEDADVPPARIGPLPRTLGDFAGAGAFLSSGLAAQVGGALRLNRRRLAQNIRDSGDAEAIAIRHTRLLEEAVSYCEREGAGLAEAAGVEWHEPDPA